jgi:hypothetical protein
METLSITMSVIALISVDRKAEDEEIIKSLARH